MPAPYRQDSFAGGVLAPEMWGRTSLDKYRSGLRYAKNFLIAPTGALKNRPGTQYLGDCSYSVSGNPGGNARLIPFTYSESQSYVLEFGPFTLRVWSNGGQVMSGGVPLSIPGSPFNFADNLELIRFAQVGDVMTLTHPNHFPRELKRLGHNSWTLTQLSFAARESGFAGNAYAPAMRVPPAGGTQHPPRYLKWKVTTLLQRADGLIFETKPWDVATYFSGGWPGARTSVTSLTNVLIACYPDRKVVIDWQGASATNPWAGFKLLGWRVYKSKGGNLFGLVGEVLPGTDIFEDYGFEPDYSQGPPQGNNPFLLVDPVTSAQSWAHPASVTFAYQRRIFGGSALKPATVWGSRVDDYGNFDNYIPTAADEAVEFELAGRQRESVAWMVGVEDVIVGTNASVWRFGGGGGEPLRADAVVDARVQSEVGVAPIEPALVGNRILYARFGGAGIEALAYDERQGSYAGFNLNVIASHFFEKNRVRALAWCPEPDRQLWVCDTAGGLFSLCYVPEQEVWAWAQHDVGAPVLSLCSVKENGEDALYLLTNRTQNVNGSDIHRVERLTTRKVLSAADGIFLDFALSYSGTPVSVLSGAGHLNNLPVWALADGKVVGPLTVASGTVTLPFPASKVHVGIKYQADAELLDLPEARTRAKTVKSVVLEVVKSLGLLVGETFTAMHAPKSRTVASSYNPLELRTEEVEVLIQNRWNQRGGGRVCIRQDEPLPLTVLAVTREVEGGD